MTIFATLRIVRLQVPEERLTLVTDPSFHAVFALTKLAGRQRAASLKGFDDTRWVTVASLAGGKVVEAFLALAAPRPVEILSALAFALHVAGSAYGAMAVAIASHALRIHIVAGTALVASFPSEIRQAGTFARHVAGDRRRPYRTAIARPAVRVPVVTADALIASHATVSFFADTCTA